MADRMAVRFWEIEQTLRACGGDAASTEEAMQEILGSGSLTYQVRADQLTLMTGERGLVLRDRGDQVRRWGLWRRLSAPFDGRTGVFR